jgi:protein-tyrosine phosphatase
MGLLSRMFKSSAPSDDHAGEGFLKVDMHSHLLPGIDDGVKDFAESMEVISNLYQMGYRKLITTPHIMSDFYRNEPQTIRALCDELRHELKKNNIDMVVECAAEYYLDEYFEEELKKKDLLYFGDKYVLVETSFMNPANNFFEMVFNLRMGGYQPVLAHPERYVFLYEDFEKYKDIFARDILFAVNLASLIGYYSKESKKISERLIKEKMVHFIGSDIHNPRLLPHLREAMKTPLYKQLETLKLKNNTLLDV